MDRPKCLVLFLACFFGCNFLFSQTPFVCKDQAFGVLNGTGDLVELVVAPSNSAITISNINNLGVNINAMGYRMTDNLIYGIDPAHHLFQIDANGTAADLGLLNLQSSLDFLAGDVHPGGQFLYAIGSSSGIDQVLVRIDLSSANYTVQTVDLDGTTTTRDISFDPYTNKLFGFDSASKKVFSMEVSTGNINLFQELGSGRDIQTLFFDSFGDLWAYGSAIYGVTSALYSIDKLTGVEVFETNGPPNSIADGASCPYSVEIKNRVEPQTIFPCSELEYVFTIANKSGATRVGIDFEHRLPEGCNYLGILQNPFGGTVEPGTPSDWIKINGLSIPQGVDSIVLLVEVGDVPGGDYNSQAVLNNLPDFLGDFRLSDDPESVIEHDSTTLTVNRIEEDSLFFTSFLCLGESVLLDGSPYGNNLLWNTGATSPNLLVSHEGVYVLEATSGCQAVVITFKVTAASCPYTIAMDHEIIPREALACNELVFRFIIKNESGLKRDSVGFVNYLKEGFSFAGFLNNPFGGSLEPGFPESEIRIRNMSLPLGTDTMDLLIAVGDVPPGDYKNRAIINNLPALIGSIRFSRDPNSSSDSTLVTILGVEDSLTVEAIICANETVVLDGSPYGLQFLWENGSTADSISVDKPGEYLLTLTGGCEPGYIFFNVKEGDPINVEIPETVVKIHLGEDYLLNPLLQNSGDTLILEWNDPLSNSLSCLDCLEPVAMPLHNTIYEIAVSNGVCSDSDSVEFIVDKERKIYIPNVFTPNFDGVNDYFFIQSPDFGIIKSLVIIDRWGTPVFEKEYVPVNDYFSGWDGQFKGNESNAGVYLWMAEIEFLDGQTKHFSGDVTLLR